MNQDKKILLKQVNLNRQKNLLYTDLNDILNVDSVFLDRIEKITKQANKDEQIIELNELTDFVLNHVINEVHRINQFIDIPRNKREELRKIYESSFEELARVENVKEYLFNHHYPALSRWLSSIYPENLREIISSSKEINSVICEEYSAEFQINLLQLNLEKLKEPILDIGCGKSGYLVKYLKSKNKEVLGIDRLIINETDYLLKTDWNEFEFKEQTWGTIISNMAFSNHMIYAVNYDQDKYELIVRKYKEILNSLKVGGEFIYAPSELKTELSEIEKGFSKENYQLSKTYQLTKIKRLLV